VFLVKKFIACTQRGRESVNGGGGEGDIFPHPRLGREWWELGGGGADKHCLLGAGGFLSKLRMYQKTVKVNEED
jgi:hypothetical protein